jgi:beta-mannosidase
MKNCIDLNGVDWQIREFLGLEWRWMNITNSAAADAHSWIPAEVPGSVMWDLYQAGKIPDPYFGINSKLVEWVPARSWVYRKTFHASLKAGERAFLVMKGIDYSAEIFLNGQSLGHHGGMFVPFESDITALLKEKDNLLIVALDCAPAEQPQIGLTSMVHTNKSRMTYGWDFCPHMVHLGIWDSVYIRITSQGRLRETFVSSYLPTGPGSAAEMIVEAETDAPDGCHLRTEIQGKDDVYETVVLGGKARIAIHIPDPVLWYPNGYGGQHLYQVRVTLLDEKGEISDEQIIRHGIRDIRWEPNKGASPEKPAFTPVINGIPLYIRGVNWVPMDVLYGRNQPDKLKRLVHLAKEAGVLMFRVWGGGIIERDSFYEACADAGILIWQEFIQSGSGVDNRTPDDPAHIVRMLKDARHIIKGKRNHTALVLWCGGNELQDDNGYPLDDSDTMLGALKGLVRTLDPHRYWLPTSSSGGFFSNTLQNCLEYPERLADVHGPWEHQGLEDHYKLYNAGTSLLSSEFGVGGFTNPAALRRILPEEAMWPVNKSNEYYYHRGAWWINDVQLQKMFGGKIASLNTMIKVSQYSQFEGLRYALEANIRRASRNSGAFPWQFNEPYPNCMCTNQVDYYGNPKPAWYAMKGAYRSLYPSLSFESALLGESGNLQAMLWLCGNPAEKRNLNGNITLKWEAHGTAGIITHGSIASGTPDPGKPLGTISVNAGSNSIILLRLILELDDKQPVINEYLFSQGKDFGALLDVKPAELSLNLTEEDVQIKNTGKTIAYFVFLSAGEDTFFHDNYFCLLPGEQRVTRSANKRQGFDCVFHAEGLNCKTEVEL